MIGQVIVMELVNNGAGFWALVWEMGSHGGCLPCPLGCRDSSAIRAMVCYGCFCHDYRFDSWAGMALARASRIQDKLNSNELKSDGPIWKHAMPVLNCFRRALEIDSSNLSLWIEYGTMSYALHSFASRQLKQWRGDLPSELVQQVRRGTGELPSSCLTRGPLGQQSSVLAILHSCPPNHAESSWMILLRRLKPWSVTVWSLVLGHPVWCGQIQGQLCGLREELDIFAVALAINGLPFLLRGNILTANIS